MSLEQDFMNYKVDDLLYCFMRVLSTSIPNPYKGDPEGTIQQQKEERMEYLTFKEFAENKKTIAQLCNVTVRTINDKVKKMLKDGLLDTQEVIQIDEKGKEIVYPVYTFPYDYKGKYQIANKDMLKYLVYTRNPQCIKIYIYLLNKYKWKTNYEFTITEIKNALGYAESTLLCNDMIKCVLDSLSREGIIDYRVKFIPEMSPSGSLYKKRIMILTHIAEDLSEIINQTN